MKENKNILSIKQRLEPSSELKNRVMERAKKLEAGRKTFGIEKTATDNIHIQKEQIKMNAYNTNETAKVRKHFPIAVISAAACAAVVIGFAAVNMNDKKPKLLPTTAKDSITTKDQTVTEDDESISENAIKVTDKRYGTYFITDEERIAAIDVLVEKAKKCHVWDGEEVPTDRTLKYVVNGEKRTVRISEVQQCPAYLADAHYSDSGMHPEFCCIITVDGASYALCEFIPDEPYAELRHITAKGGYIFFQRNDDYYKDLPVFAEYEDETTAEKLYDIIEDISKNGSLKFETDAAQPWLECEELSSLGDASASCSFELNGNSYDIYLYMESEQIVIMVDDWSGNTHSVLYKDAQKWISETNEVFDSLKNLPEVDYLSGEGTEVSDTQEDIEEEYFAQEENTETSDDQKEKAGFSETYEEKKSSSEKTKLPELFDLTEEQAVAALKEAGLNAIIGYRFDDYYEKGYVSSYYDPSEDLSGIVDKGTYVAVDISLGKYDGPNEMIIPEFATGYYPGKDSKLEVPLPDGLSGSYTFEIYSANDVEYTETADASKGAKSVTFDIYAIDKDRRVIYAKNNNSSEEKLIRYATYEFDYATEKWTLIGELNTDELI